MTTATTARLAAKEVVKIDQKALKEHRRAAKVAGKVIKVRVLSVAKSAIKQRSAGKSQRLMEEKTKHMWTRCGRWQWRWSRRSQMIVHAIFAEEGGQR